MRFNFDEKVCNLEGIPLKMDGFDVTLKFCAISALFANYDDERPSPSEKCFRHELASRLHCGNWEITVAERDKLKLMIGKQFNALIVGPCYRMLENPIPSQNAPEKTKNDQKPKKKQPKA